MVIFEGKVYDVKEYMPDHPGGPEYLSKNLGTNIEEEFEDAEHTKSARKTLLKLPVVGTMGEETSASLSDEASELAKTAALGGLNVNAKGNVANLFGEEFESKYNFDYDKPLLPQIYNATWTFKSYNQYINEPKLLTNPVRDVILFENPILELTTFSPWWGIPIVWSVYLFYCSFYISSDPYENLLLIIGGLLTWTFGEYALHRFLFHAEDNWLEYLPENSGIYMVHFLVHGIHHAFPSDRYRLVFPPVPGFILLYGVVKPFFIALLGNEKQNAFTIGFISGYVCYDMIHYYLHHGSCSTEYMRDLKVYHMQHHYKFSQSGYGVSSKIWDYILGTEIKKTGKDVKEAKH